MCNVFSTINATLPIQMCQVSTHINQYLVKMINCFIKYSIHMY